MAAVTNRSVFGIALTRLLDSWTALQLAVQQSFGGPDSQEKAAWMVYAIETWFNENDGIETYEVEDFLQNILNTEFDLILEDNSIPEIASLICLYYRLSQENKIDELRQRLQALPQPSLEGCQFGGEQLEYDSEEDLIQEASHSNQMSHPPPSTPQTHQATSGSTQSSGLAGDADSMEEDDQPQEDGDGWQVMRHGRKKK